MALRYGDPGAVADAAAELEELGYGALWIPDVGGDLFASIEALLDATTTATVATGILNLWLHEPAETAQRCAELTDRHGRRLLVGIGVSHAPLVEGVGAGEYTKPLTRMREYLDGLDAAAPPWRSRTVCSLRSVRRCWTSPATAAPARTPTWSRPSTPGSCATPSAPTGSSHRSRRWC